MHTFILAGGFATRLWPLTEKRAKPLLPVAGKPIITHLVEKIPAEIPLTVSTNAVFGDGFHAWMKNLGRKNMELIIEGTKRDDHKLGALGSIAEWITENRIDDDLLILTGDNYLGFSLSRFLETFRGNPLLAAHDIGDLERAKAFGTVLIEKTGNSPLPLGEGPGVRVVTGFEEKPAKPQSTLVSTGCVILPKATLPVLVDYAKVKPDNLGGIFEEFLRRGIPVDCFTFSEQWMDIGAFHSYLDAHRTLVGAATIASPSSILTNVHTEGSVTVGDRCVIENSDLRDCMIFDRCDIRDCSLRDCVIDEGCVLQGIDLKGKMLRAKTRLIVDSRG